MANVGRADGCYAAKTFVPAAASRQSANPSGHTFFAHSARFAAKRRLTPHRGRLRRLRVSDRLVVWREISILVVFKSTLPAALFQPGAVVRSMPQGSATTPKSPFAQRASQVCERVTFFTCAAAHHGSHLKRTGRKHCPGVLRRREYREIRLCGLHASAASSALASANVGMLAPAARAKVRAGNALEELLRK